MLFVPKNNPRFDDWHGLEIASFLAMTRGEEIKKVVAGGCQRCSFGAKSAKTMPARAWQGHREILLKRWAVRAISGATFPSPWFWLICGVKACAAKKHQRWREAPFGYFWCGKSNKPSGNWAANYLIKEKLLPEYEIPQHSLEIASFLAMTWKKKFIGWQASAVIRYWTRFSACFKLTVFENWWPFGHLNVLTNRRFSISAESIWRADRLHSGHKS